jgi:hypothetical protein
MPPTVSSALAFQWRSHQGRFKFTWQGLETLTLDECLRPLGWSYQGNLYRRGLDGKILEIVRDGDPRYKMHHSHLMTPTAGEEMLKIWAERVAISRPDLPDWLSKLPDDCAHFRSVFRPISILPPDQYRSLVLQLTEGCAWNRCHFCNLYRETPFRSKTADEFAQHTEQALAYFGEAIHWRRGIFLGDANVGALPQTVLAEALAYLQGKFPAPLRDEQGNPRHPLEFESVSAFMDTFTGKLRTPKEWGELRQLGLRQLHLGVESGSPTILKLLGKPSKPSRVIELVRRLKQANLAVSIILMLGVGGQEGAQDHEQQTLSLLAQLPLRLEDRVYLSELLVHPGSEYAALSQQQGLTPLTRPECRQQAERIREQLPWPSYPDGPIVSLYDVRQFVYH